MSGYVSRGCGRVARCVNLQETPTEGREEYAMPIDRRACCRPTSRLEFGLETKRIAAGDTHTCNNDTANRPRHLKRSRASTTKNDRYDLGGISRGISDEKTPRNALKQLTDGEESKRVGLHNSIS